MYSNNTYKYIYIQWSPNGSSQNISLNSTEKSNIGKFRTMKIKSITTPITFYAISSINNVALLEEDNSGTWNSFTLTPGNYNSSEFETEVKTQLESTGSGTYSISISDITGKLTISVSGGASTFSIAFTENNKPKEKIWGVPSGTAGQDASENPPNNAQINDTPSSSYTSTNPVQLWGPDQILLISNELNNMIVYKNTDISQDQSNVILKIPITTTPFSQQTYNENENAYGIKNQTLPDTIDLDITDEYGNSLNFNGGYCYLSIAVGLIR